MPNAAILLQFRIAADAFGEHDDWHTHEHMPERLALPGFLRGTRWTGIRDPDQYCVLYELATVDALESNEYRHRLDNPTAWTSKMMHAYRNMRRTLCAIDASGGTGLGGFAAVLSFAPAPESDSDIRDWLLRDVLPPLGTRPGFASWQLLRSERVASSTKEQAIRGPDAAVQAAVFVTAYDADALAKLCETELGRAQLQAHGADPSRCTCSLYKLAMALS